MKSLFVAAFRHQFSIGQAARVQDEEVGLGEHMLNVVVEVRNQGVYTAVPWYNSLSLCPYFRQPKGRKNTLNC